MVQIQERIDIMSVKIKCEIVSKGLTLPCDRTGLEWARNVWLWLAAYTNSEIHDDLIDDSQRGKIVACLQILNDMSVMTDDTLEAFMDNLNHNECSELHEIAKKQAQIATDLYWNV